VTATAPSLLLAAAKAEKSGAALPEQLAQRLAHAMEELLSALARSPVGIAAGAATNSRYAEWRIAQNPFGALLRFDLGRHDETLVHLPGTLIGQLVDLNYGGYGDTPPSERFTPTEQRLASRLGERLETILQAALAPYGFDRARFVAAEFDLLQAGWAKPREAIAVQTFSVDSGPIRPVLISLIAAATTVSTMGRFEQKDAHPATTDASWASRMRGAAMQIRLPARAVLTDAELPLPRLLALAPGDILPLLLPTAVKLTVDGREFARGTLGEANGCAALQIETMEKEMDQ
jgi:flagellar motor switch protein FliM